MRGSEVENKPLSQKSLRVYAFLQALTLIACWGWFAALWSLAFFQYKLEENIEWWFLVASACAGLYGLRPNLERAIDTAWLRGISNPKALAERIAQLKPIKRRINLIFSIAVLVLLVIVTILYFRALPTAT